MSHIFYISVRQPFERIEEMLTWARVNCPSYITNDAVKKDRDDWYYRFYFGQEKDYLLFALKWS